MIVLILLFTYVVSLLADSWLLSILLDKLMPVACFCTLDLHSTAAGDGHEDALDKYQERNTTSHLLQARACKCTTSCWNTWDLCKWQRMWVAGCTFIIYYLAEAYVPCGLNATSWLHNRVFLNQEFNGFSCEEVRILNTLCVSSWSVGNDPSCYPWLSLWRRLQDTTLLPVYTFGGSAYTRVLLAGGPVSSVYPIVLCQ